MTNQETFKKYASLPAYMSLIGMGNAYNTSAEWQERRRREKERLRAKIEEADESRKARLEAAHEVNPILSGMMDQLYDGVSSGYSTREEISSNLSDISGVLFDAKISTNSENMRQRLSTLETMAINIHKSISRYHSTPSLAESEERCIEELYKSYLNRIEGKFGQEMYERIYQ